MSDNSLTKQLEAIKKQHTKHVKELIEDLRDKDREIRLLKEEIASLKKRIATKDKDSTPWSDFA